MHRKKRSYYKSIQRLTMGLVLTVIGLQLWILFLFFGVVSADAENETGVIVLSLFLLADAIAGWYLFYAIWKKQKSIRNLCQKFIDGKIYNEFFEEMLSVDEQLTQAFKRMDGLLNRQNTIQLATKQAEFLALQNQINPHFLYNTLDAIRGDALSIGAEEIADITEALSTFFQYTITNTSNLVPLELELESVYNYFLIQKYRFDDKMSLEVQLKDESDRLKQMLCPKLMLQPIVENAIFHGLETVTDCGKILISVELVDDKLRIDVSDNGAGMQEEKLKKLNEKLSRNSVGTIVENKNNKRGGIALLNVCRRIKLLFGEQYGIRINSILGVGTLVEISLPVKLSEEL